MGAFRCSSPVKYSRKIARPYDCWRFQRLDWHPCSDAFAIGCNIMIYHANSVSAIRFWDHTRAEPNH